MLLLDSVNFLLYICSHEGNTRLVLLLENELRHGKIVTSRYFILDYLQGHNHRLILPWAANSKLAASCVFKSRVLFFFLVKIATRMRRTLCCFVLEQCGKCLHVFGNDQRSLMVDITFFATIYWWRVPWLKFS